MGKMIWRQAGFAEIVALNCCPEHDHSSVNIFNTFMHGAMLNILSSLWCQNLKGILMNVILPQVFLKNGFLSDVYWLETSKIVVTLIGYR